MAKDFSKRTKSATRYAGTNSGFMNDFVHLAGTVTNYQVTPAGGYVLHAVIVNNKGSSGVIVIKCGSDIIAELAPDSAREFKYSCYLYDKLYISTTDSTSDLTVVISKG